MAEDRLNTFGRHLDVAGREERIAALDTQAAAPDFWNNSEQAQRVLKERAELSEPLAAWRKQLQELDDVKVFAELAAEGTDDAEAEAAAKLTDVEQALERMELQRKLGGEHDAGNAIVTLHPGAGGTEAQDWAEMLLRMYLRWAERKGFKAELVDSQPGEGAGIKNATITVAGPYAFGYLKAEAGIHRLVRISPFDSNARRHTSFASVFVYPEIDEEVEVEINEADLRVDTYRSSGAGGQHVNKTDSAVRLTHLPTGIVVACQNERSQHKNKSMAMKILRARLYELEKEKQREKMAEMDKAKKDIAWGSQIRSYVLHPYRLVKDHRTGIEIGNADGVLDGDLDQFIEAYLQAQAA
ncbi:MAG TPA: peptide chain release factor 2 [Candidatus Margulisiibacteriota bacterium]|nr:peptide chain release factor 2 [Candidatus Margulisiibacteriota bacterium]